MVGLTPFGLMFLGSPARATVGRLSVVPMPTPRMRSASHAPFTGKTRARSWSGLPSNPVRIAVLLVSLWCPSLSTIDSLLSPVCRQWLLWGWFCFHRSEEFFSVALSHSFQAYVDLCPVGHP